MTRRHRPPHPHRDPPAVEFLDTEWYYVPQLPPEPPAQPEPWRSHRLAAQCFLFPRELLWELAQGERLARILQDKKYLVQLRANLQEAGLREPLELVIDQAGMIVLRDGHHRLASTEGLDGFAQLPAHFTVSEGIAVQAVMTVKVLDRMLRHVAPAS